MGVDGQPYGGRRTPTTWGLTQPHPSPRGEEATTRRFLSLPGQVELWGSTDPHAPDGIASAPSSFALASLRAGQVDEIELRPLPPSPTLVALETGVRPAAHVPEFRASGSSPPSGRSEPASTATGYLHLASREISRPRATSCVPARSQRAFASLFRCRPCPTSCSAAQPDLSVGDSDLIGNTASGQGYPQPGHEFLDPVGRTNHEDSARALTSSWG